MSEVSKVFYIDLRANMERGLVGKIKSLVEAAGIGECTKKGGLSAVKIHFGERGNTAFIRPILVRPIVDAVKEAGGKPFLTDASTLYVGTRSNAVDHLATAALNGFLEPVVGAPVIIADGLSGGDEEAVPIGLKHCQEAYIGSAIANADALVSVAHFKLHEMSGFGGTIKNLGMGSGSRRGKMAQHCEVAPVVDVKKCIGCGQCRERCAHDAISLVARPDDIPRPKPQAAKMASIDSEKCVGCASCIHACPEHAIEVNWKQDLNRFMERMVEYSVGVVMGKERRSLFVNFLTQISPACDCYPFADAPIVADIGIVASRDPVAIDQASVDLLNAQPVLGSCCIEHPPKAGGDLIRAVYPYIPWEHQLDYAQEVGLGSRAYELVSL
jgi:uncharacterized Fe-S center protein